MSNDSANKGYVTISQLAAEIRALRWEMRALIAVAAVANIGLAYGLDVPPVPQAIRLIVGLF